MKFVVDKMLLASQLPKRTVALVLAGGRGTRLKQLTENRAKPAVYFGGKFRIIDFVLSNCINSGIRRIGVITQYQPHSLIRHLQRGWNFLRGEQNEFIDLMPAGQQRADGQWYRGTADAICQNIGILRSYSPEYILVLAGDHVYKMDYSQLLTDHASHGKPCTVACIEVPRESAKAFGVMAIDENRQITNFLEKPADPPGMPDNPDLALASMGIYVFNAEYLFNLLLEDEGIEASSHDFGNDLIPKIVEAGDAVAHNFSMSCVPPASVARPYWRDVGTVDAFWSANMDLASDMPELNIYDEDWPIWAHQENVPSAKFVPDPHGMNCVTSNTMVSGGCIICGSMISKSVLFSRVFVDSFCRIDQAVLLPGVRISQGARLMRVVIDRGCVIPPGLVVGENPEEDARRFFRTDNGIVLITEEMLKKL